MQLEGLGKFKKNPMTSSGLEPVRQSTMLLLAPKEVMVNLREMN
jgi:hypothetical protein